ncbi:MAG: DUF1934 domain-containing protein [Lachnospiraceae bacterium]|nr:DUF1934 domain-containing protein [Lachnospiraceae bacterium]
MTKDVTVYLHSRQHGQGISDTEEIVTTVSGKYYEKNGRYFLIYDEMMEGLDKPVKNKVKFGEHFMELTKSGPVNVRMVFEEDKKNLTNYTIPYGNIVLGIDTKKIHISQESDRIVVDVEYVLDMNYEYYADCKIVMDIRSK